MQGQVGQRQFNYMTKAVLALSFPHVFTQNINLEINHKNQMYIMCQSAVSKHLIATNNLMYLCFCLQIDLVAAVVVVDLVVEDDLAEEVEVMAAVEVDMEEVDTAEAVAEDMVEEETTTR